MKRGLIFLGILIFTGIGTNFLIRFLRDGDFYYAEFAASLIGVIMICIGISRKKSSKPSNNSY